ncbi:MAG: tyrosine--tRNA ligase [Desulfovibrionales bacterium]
MNVFDELKWRGLVNQVSSEEKVRQYLSTPGRSMYCGFDPTARSLHIGNLVPLIALLRFQRAGHNPIFLAGGGTGLIGDPSGKSEERLLNAPEKINDSLLNIRRQVEKIFGGEVHIVNNGDWLCSLTAIELLRDVGKHFTVNWMMAKDSVKSRISREDVGISFTEFSYMILQAYDFYKLFCEHDCRLQIGGSDQWGNITAGTELIRRKSEGEAFALTFPLITTADGKKFGKSEKGAIYLDPEITSPYEFYQYWVRADDRDVINLLRYFTFLSREEIEELERELAAAPEKRTAQKRLAAEMTTLVHGAETLRKIENATQVLFGGGDITTVDVATLKSALQEAPSVFYPSLTEIPDLPQILVDLGLCPSKGQAKKDIKAGAVSLNTARVQDIGYRPSAEDLLHGEAVLLRKGKKHYGLAVVGKG